MYIFFITFFFFFFFNDTATTEIYTLSLHDALPICPQGVRTGMLDGSDPGAELVLGDSVITPEAVADAVLKGIADGRFLILPHPEVAAMYAGRAAETDRWLRGMNKIQRKIEDAMK